MLTLLVQSVVPVMYGDRLIKFSAPPPPPPPTKSSFWKCVCTIALVKHMLYSKRGVITGTSRYLPSNIK